MEGLGQRRFLRTLRRLISRLKLRGEGWADLNFEGDDFMGVGEPAAAAFAVWKQTMASEDQEGAAEAER